MTAPYRELVQDAARAGYTITYQRGRTLIVRKHKRTGRILRGLVLYANGTALDVTLRLDVTKGLRSYAAMRRVLGLTGGGAA